MVKTNAILIERVKNKHMTDKQAPIWYRMWAGHRKALPLSEGQGHTLARVELAPLNAQIAVFFGSRSGNLESLQTGVMKLANHEPIICQACNGDIWTTGHGLDCEIVALSNKVVSEPPQPVEKPKISPSTKRKLKTY